MQKFLLTWENGKKSIRYAESQESLIEKIKSPSSFFHVLPENIENLGGEWQWVEKTVYEVQYDSLSDCTHTSRIVAESADQAESIFKASGVGYWGRLYITRGDPEGEWVRIS